LKDIETDVVVVGCGNAAMAAAGSAHEAGARVVVLEKLPEAERGGNSAHSFAGVFRFPHNGIRDLLPLVPPMPETEVERHDIPPYTRDDFYADLMRVTQGRADPTLTELLVTQARDTVEWMVRWGVGFELHYVDAVEVGGRIRLPRGAVAVHAYDGGLGAVDAWIRVLRPRGVQVLFDTGAVELLVDEAGAVQGVVAQDAEGRGTIRAKGVVLGCGGFGASPEMRARYLGPGWDLVKVRGSRANTGDGLTMALAIGAQPYGHFSGCHASPIDADAPDMSGAFLKPGERGAVTHRYFWNLGVVVNIQGQRFLDEGEDIHNYTYAKTGRRILQQPGGVAHQIFDAKTRPLLPEMFYAGATPTVASTIAELADLLDIRREALVTTVADFNAAVVDDRPFDPVNKDGRLTQGITPAKSNWAQRLDTPPYTAFGMTCGLTFTFGGLKINTRCQVLSTQEQPIQGLYAAGEMTGGFFYHNYPGGSGLVRGAVTGRIAGRNAAQDAGIRPS